MKKSKLNVNNRKSIYVDLNDFCHLAQQNDTLEITEWGNGEGYDIDFNRPNRLDQRLQLTHGELDAIQHILAKFNDEILLDD